MNAAGVLEALRRRWPADQYLMIEEAPQDAMRQGRKLDALVVSLWASRGFDLDGVEIKVSYSDWKRELGNAAKADWWWNHVHRFWIAAPTKLAGQIRDELPADWGLLACSRDGTPGALVKAIRHEAEPLPWPTTIGLLRTASGAGSGALQRARDAGAAAGLKEGRERALRELGESQARRDLDALTAKVEAFRAAAGVNIARTWSPEDASRVGRLYATYDEWSRNPSTVQARLRTAAKQLGEHAAELDVLAESLSPVLDVQAREAAS